LQDAIRIEFLLKEASVIFTKEKWAYVLFWSSCAQTTLNR